MTLNGNNPTLIINPNIWAIRVTFLKKMCEYLLATLKKDYVLHINWNHFKRVNIELAIDRILIYQRNKQNSIKTFGWRIFCQISGVCTCKYHSILLRYLQFLYLLLFPCDFILAIRVVDHAHVSGLPRGVSNPWLVHSSYPQLVIWDSHRQAFESIIL